MPGPLSLFQLGQRAMAAQMVRMNAAASNLANAGSVAASEGEAYRPLRPVFAEELDSAAGLSTVRVPVVLILLLVQLLTGVLSRSAPSLNLFALGLPAGVLAGIAALIIAAPLMFEQFGELVELSLTLTERILLR